MIKGIIFDCFGVLIGTGYWNIYQRVGGDRPQDKEFINDLLDKSNLNLVDNTKLHVETAKRLGITLSEWEDAVMKDELPNPELFKYIQNHLYGKYKLAILSNAGSGTLDRKIPEGLLRLFDVKMTSGDLGMVKPDPEIYRVTAGRMEIKPEEAIFIDDHKKYLTGAEEVGMKTVLFDDSSQVIRDIETLLR